MAIVKAGIHLFNTGNQLIIKKSRGNNCVSLWKNTKTMYNTMQLSEGSILNIEFENAKCGVLEVENCAWVNGSIGFAEVGNSLTHQGRIEVARAGNRCTLSNNIVVRTIFQEQKAKIDSMVKQLDETITEINERRGMYANPHFTDEMLMQQLNAFSEKKLSILSQLDKQNTDTIRIRGELERLIVFEPNARAVSVIVTGEVKRLKVGNCLYSIGTIKEAHANNMIYANEITKILDRQG